MPRFNFDIGVPRSENVLDVILRSSRPLADGVSLICFESASDIDLPGFAPGSHICLVLPNGMRPCYSLIDPPSMAPRRHYTIAVRLNAAGQGASRYLCETARTGDTFQILPPADRFPLAQTATRHVLIAGGIGITPLWSMIQALAARGADWCLYYACSRRAAAPFVDEIQALQATALGDTTTTQDSPAGRVVFAFSDEGGHFDIDRIVAEAPTDAHLYCCGPARMLDAFRDATASRAQDTVHWEQFNDAGRIVDTSLAPDDRTQDPALSDSPVGPDGFGVSLARSGQHFVVPLGKTILEVLLEAGVAADYGCRQGNCGACETTVLDGTPDHRDWVLSDEERVANRTMMICCSRSRSATLVLDL